MRKTNISFVTSVPLSVRPHGTTRLPLDGYWWNMMFELFPRLCLEDSSFIEICYELRVVYINAFSRLWQYRAEFILEWEIFHTKVVEKLKTHFIFYNFFSRKSCRLWDNIEKCDVTGDVTNYSDIWRRRVACWVSKATRSTYMHAPTRPAIHTRARAHAHTQNEIRNSNCLFTSTVVFLKAPHRYVISSLPMLVYMF